jgi:IS1 family transposase
VLAASENRSDTKLRPGQAPVVGQIQCDEIWSFVYAKQKQVTPKMAEERNAGDVWTWVAMDAQPKLVCSWLVGRRDAGCATEFIQNLANRVQLTTDGHKVYLDAVADAFATEIDYAMLVKIYGNEPEAEKRYSPVVCNGHKKTSISGDQIRSTFRRAISSVSTSPCGCRCGDSPA